MGLCGSGGRHLPQLHNNPNVELAAIVQRSEQPTAAAYLHTELESKTQLQERCEGMPIKARPEWRRTGCTSRRMQHCTRRSGAGACPKG